MLARFDVKKLRHTAGQVGDLQKSKKDILQVFGPNPEPHHHEFAQWASKALPNQNWQVWAARNYKQNPEQFTSKTKQTLEHYGGSTHIPEIKDLRFEKEHDLKSGIELFREAERKYNNRIKNKLNLVKPRPETNLFVKVPNSDHHWYDLGVGSCKAEGKAMGHCGNAPSEYEGDRILSLRKEHVLGGKKYHQPHLTFIYNNGYLGEMKGRANEKPSPKYHEHIVELLKDPRIKGILGGGYQDEKNFKFSDLSPEHQEEVLRANPNLITDTESENNIEKILSTDLPEKHRKSVILSIAERPNLDPKFYERLVNDKNHEVRAAIAKNPNLDPKFHERLVNDKKSLVREAIAENPNLHPKFYGQLVNNRDSSIREAIAQNPNLDPKFHKKLANDKDPWVRKAIAKNPNLDPKSHEQLVNDKDHEVRLAIAENPNLDPKFHEKLVNDEGLWIRTAIAENPNLHPKFHEQLVNDESWRVRLAIAQNPNLHPKFYEKLINDENPFVRAAIAGRSDLDPKFHEKLAQDKHEMVREVMISNPSYRRNLRLSESQDDSLQKSKKDILQVFGPNPEPHHHEFAQWASKALPNQNWQVWAARNYKQNPEQFTSETKQTLEHYGGSTHIPEIKELRFDKEHDLESGINLFRKAERKYNNRIKDKLNLVKPRLETNLFVKVPNSDHHWYDLGVGACEIEGKAMGHCGNVPSEYEGDRILSLRKEHVLGGKKYHEPHLTFIYNDGYLGEMKGRANEKPSPKYHEHIVELLKDPRIKGILGGGYQDEKNFKFSDLSPEHQEEVLRANPNLITDTKSKHNLIKIIDVDWPKKYSKAFYNIVANLAADPKLHDKMVNSKNYQVREVAAQNPNLDPKFHERLVNDEHSWVRGAIAQSPNLDPKFYEQLVNDESEYVRKAIAQKPNLDPRFHEKLANDKSIKIKRIIAEKPNLDPKLYEKLIGNEDREIKISIAGKQDLEPKFHEQLVNDKDPRVREAIAHNPNLDPKFHEQLVNDKDPLVRKAIAKNPNLDPKSHEQLVNDKDHEVRLAIAENPNLDPKFHEKLVNDEGPWVRTAIAENPNLHPKFYGQLVNDGDSSVREAIAQNPNLDPKFHEQLVNDKDPLVRKAIAKNPNLDPKSHEQLVNDGNSLIRAAVAKSPNLNPKFHEQLVNDKNYEVRAAIAENPNLDPKFYEQLVNDKNWRVRLVIASNPNLDPKFHEQLANDTDPSVRRAMINNPSYKKSRSVAKAKNEQHGLVFRKSEELAFTKEILTQNDTEKISHIVQQIRDNKHLFQPLRNKNPNLYSSIVDLLNALKLILQHAKHTDNERDVRLAETINDHLKQAEHSAAEGETAKVVDALSGALSQHKYNLEKSDEIYTDLPSTPLRVNMSDRDKIKIGEVLNRLNSNKKDIENLAEKSPEAYEMIVNITKILSDLFNSINNEPVEAAEHHFQVQQHLDQAQATSNIKEGVHLKASPRQKKITHGSKEFPIGVIREYNPQSAREKTPDGRWISVAANVKREDWQ